jgi:4'-phosphopantetheinyl transferase
MSALQPCKQPAPSVSEIHLWRAALDSDAWPTSADLIAAERDRAARLRRPGARRRWVAARLALRGVLARYLTIAPEEIDLWIAPGGKPKLAVAGEGGKLRFNLSHSSGVALIAVGWEREVGVDVERIDSRRDVLALARRGLASDEARTIERAAPALRSNLFYAAWTRREAIAKCFGTGLATAAPEDPVSVTAIDVGPGFAAAVAVAGTRLPRLGHFVIESDRVSSPAS